MISIAGEDTLAEKRALTCPPPSMPSEATKTVGTNRAEADMMETDAVAERRWCKAIRCRPPSVVSSTADPDRTYSYQDGARAVLRLLLWSAAQTGTSAGGAYWQAWKARYQTGRAGSRSA